MIARQQLGKTFLTMFLGMLLVSCPKKQVTYTNVENQPEPALNAVFEPAVTMAWQDRFNLALYMAELPAEIKGRLVTVTEESAFMQELSAILQGDRYIRLLVDKQHPLPDGYEPQDLIELSAGDYQIARRGLMLRRPAVDALQSMAQAAKSANVTLQASSTYRSYTYQVDVYARNVRELGQAVADRESARPGYSQHQTGLVIDFGSIDDSFARTSAGRWMQTNASRFGWSLSFPDGYEAATGYRWESWHYRYVGTDLARFIDQYFEGIQQYALRFIYEWEKIESTTLS
jgi:D-alanyl-D-alanine carboxypeptidase